MFLGSGNTTRLLQRLPDVILCLLPVVTTIFDFPFNLRSDRILASSPMLHNPEDVGIAVRISQLSCIQAELYDMSFLLPVSDRHL